MKYIRDYYGVPAKRGGRIAYTGDGKRTLGTITGAKNARLWVRFDSLPYTVLLHPTWEVEYVERES